MSEPIHIWARDAGEARHPIESLIDALRASDPGMPLWSTLGGAIDETNCIGQFLARWWLSPHPEHSVARVVDIPPSVLSRVPRMFTNPLAIQAVRGEQVYLLILQND